MNIEEWEAVADENIHRLRTGNIDAKTANAMSNALGKRVSMIGKELDYLHMRRQNEAIPFMERTKGKKGK